MRGGEDASDVETLSIDLPLYIFTLMMIERPEKRWQFASNFDIVGLIALKLIFDICSKECPEFVKLDSEIYVIFGEVIFENIIVELDLFLN